MTDQQLYLALALPSLMILMGTLVNVGYFVMLNQRMSRFEDKMDILTGKVVDMDNRVIRMEDKR